MRDQIKIILTLLVALSVSSLYAQDYHLTMYESAPQLVNPSETGLFKDPNTAWRATANYRSQWFSTNSKGFNSAHISFDKKEKQWGYGGYINNNRAMGGGFNTLNIILSGSYDVISKQSADHTLRVGIQMGLLNKVFRADEFTFDSQYDPSLGFDQSVSNGESFSKTSLFKFDAAIGVMYKMMATHTQIQPYGGFALYHITRPNESLFDDREPIPLRYTVHGGARIDVTSDISVTPRVLFMYQGRAIEVNTNVLGTYKLNEEWTIRGGGGYRWSDAAIFFLGVENGGNVYTISYDQNISPLKVATRGLGAMEIGVQINGLQKRSTGGKFGMPSIFN